MQHIKDKEHKKDGEVVEPETKAKQLTSRMRKTEYIRN